MMISLVVTLTFLKMPLHNEDICIDDHPYAVLYVDLVTFYV